MKTWHIRAHGAFEAIAGEHPDTLKQTISTCLARPPRRINRYIRLALIGAHRCVAQLDDPLPGDTPLYVASEQGSVAEAVDLMDEIVHHGHSPRPMSFVNVSSNMVGYYLAASLGLGGRNMNVARHHGAFGAMLELAQLESSLDRSVASTLLLGSVTECVWPLAEHRQRCALPANTPLVEGSYWLVVHEQADQPTENSAPQLAYARTSNQDEARDWLAAGDCWVMDPHLPPAQQQALMQHLETSKAWHAPWCHPGHADAVVHALFAALHTRPLLRLHVVAADASGGYQLMGICQPDAAPFHGVPGTGAAGETLPPRSRNRSASERASGPA